MDCEMNSKDEETEEATPPKAEENKKENNIAVILVGWTGSGKSTFSEDVMKTFSHSWVRVCQEMVLSSKQSEDSY